MLNNGYTNQSGSVLLEGMIAILIFSMGILAVIGLQANAMNSVGESKYRMEAGFLANQIISDMWAETPAEIINYELDPGDDPGDKTANWVNKINQTLPAAADFPPSIEITDASDSVGTKYLVTVTVRWKSAKEQEVHRYVSNAYINHNI